jgi:hypothetical protein
MSIIVTPHNQKEEKALLAFLDSMKYEYVQANDDAAIFSPAQQQELLERDRQFEAGEIETYTLEQVMNYFRIKK